MCNFCQPTAGIWSLNLDCLAMEFFLFEMYVEVVQPSSNGSVLEHYWTKVNTIDM